uniref:very-long-chain 3-oxoacyl-CoA reductase n=1 Tax=Myxine glutinosa TaxID=7769 RepID=UPI00358F8676
MAALCSCCYWIGMALAALLCLRLACGLLCALWTFGLARLLRFGADFSSCGRWAVITGATDGIGKAYAIELARKGKDIVLISRSQEKLSKVALEIADQFHVVTKTIAVDFSNVEGIYSTIADAIKGLDIGILVNNVGTSHTYPEYFLDIADLNNVIPHMINVNIFSVVKMTQLVLPGMVERSRGIIINIASATALIPCSLLSLYSASKAYVDFFSRALDTEYRSRGIIVQSVLPFFVVTNMSRIKKASLDKPDPGTYAQAALATVGLRSRTCGYLPHSIMGWIITTILPSFATEKILLENNKLIRARYLKKKAQ